MGDDQSSDAMAEAGFDPDSPDGLIESMDPRSSFEPERWAFEQLSLQLSVVNRCGNDCPGPPQPETTGAAMPTAPIDPRWQALQQLRESRIDA